MNVRTYSVLLSYNDMNLIYQKLQQSDIDDKSLKKVERSFRIAQLSYGVQGAFYEC